MYCETYPQPRAGKLLLLFAVVISVLAVLPIFAVNWQGKDHAELKHGVTEVEVIRACSSSQRGLVVKNEDDGRLIKCVQLPDGRWAFHIIEKANGKWEEVTAFPRKVGKDFSDLWQRLVRRNPNWKSSDIDPFMSP